MTAAGLGVRLRAFVWDYLLMLLYVLLLALLAWLAPPLQASFRQPGQRDAAAFLVLVLPVALYFALAEGRAQGRTWGKRKLKLRVVRAGGGPLGLPRALLRKAGKFLPWQLAHLAIFRSLPDSAPAPGMLWLLYGLAYGLAFLYLLTIWRRADHCAPYDWLAASAVIEIDRPRIERTGRKELTHNKPLQSDAAARRC